MARNPKIEWSSETYESLSSTLYNGNISQWFEEFNDEIKY